MCQKEFPKAVDMNTAVARDMHQEIIARLMSGPGDSEGAMHKAERMFGLPYWCQFNLRHKRRASPSFISRVHGAYVSMLEKSVKRDLEALQMEKARADADVELEGLIAEAQDLLAALQKRREAKGVKL